MKKKVVRCMIVILSVIIIMVVIKVVWVRSATSGHGSFDAEILKAINSKSLISPCRQRSVSMMLIVGWRIRWRVSMAI